MITRIILMHNDAEGEGSRGGKVVGHTSRGNPVYASANGPDRAERWEYRSHRAFSHGALHPEQSKDKYRSSVKSALVGALNRAKVPHRIESPHDSTSDYFHVGRVTIRVADHPPPKLGLGKTERVVGGFNTKTGKRHYPADMSFHPGSQSKIHEAVALLEAEHKHQSKRGPGRSSLSTSAI